MNYRLLCLVGIATTLVSRTLAGELPHISSCDQRPIVQQAVAIVAKLPEFKKKALQIDPLELSVPDFALHSAEVGNRCGTIVSVYVEHPDRLEMWGAFFVDSELHSVTYATGVDGTFIKLAQWRALATKSTK